MSSPENELAPSNQAQILNGVNDRIEKIEQNLNSNLLICRGRTVESLITESTSGAASFDLERLKGKVCEAVCGNEATGVDISELQVSVFGRNKKLLKVDCGNPVSKEHLLKQARKKRPADLYVSEFLTSSKLSILYNLRQLKKLHPGKFKAIFTKGGNIYYRLQNADRAHQVSSLDDLSRIFIVGTSNGESGGN